MPGVKQKLYYACNRGTVNSDKKSRLVRQQNIQKKNQSIVNLNFEPIIASIAQKSLPDLTKPKSLRARFYNSFLTLTYKSAKILQLIIQLFVVRMQVLEIAA